MHELLSALHGWRARPSAILPLAFLHALAVGLDGLPVTYLLRSIRCEEYRAQLSPHLPEENVCRSPAVQKAYSTDLAIYHTIYAVLSIVLSGPYGELSDFRGRKRALAIPVALNGLGDAWLALCSSVAPLRKPWIFQFAAAIQGLGGGFSVVMAGQNAFIADTSAPSERSYYMGLSLAVWWLGIAVGPLVSAVLLEKDLYAVNFGIATLTWALYLPYLVLVLREARVPLAESEAENAASETPSETGARQPAVSKLRTVVRTVFEPLIILVEHVPLLLVSVAMTGTVLSIGAFALIIPYCDTKFGLGPSEAGILTAAWPASRATCVFVLLPMLMTAYRWFNNRFGNRKASQRQSTSVYGVEPADETALLLTEVAQEPEASHEAHRVEPADQKVEAASILQELTIVRVCLMLDAVGMIAIERSRSTGEVILATVMSSLAAPAGPSMQALLTLAAPPGEVGRVLAGMSIVQSAAVALRNPAFVPLFNATLEKAPGAVWWLSALMLMLCSLVMFCLRPRQFVYAHDGPA